MDIYLDRKQTIKNNDQLFWQREAKFWNNYGKIYQHLEVSTPYKKMLERMGQIIKVQNRSIWLDAGCGPGTMIDLILKNQHNPKKIIGIDFDGVMIDNATKRLSQKLNVQLKTVDLSKKLEFSDNEFEGIVANLVLSYVVIYDNKYVGNEALMEVLKEMYRVLKNNGLFIWTTPVKKVDFSKVFFASWRQVFNPLTPKYIYYGPRVLSYALKIQQKGRLGLYHFLDDNYLLNMMKQVGFNNIKIEKTFANQAYLISASK